MRFEIQLPDNKSLRIRELIWSWVRRGEVLPISTDDCRDIVITHRALTTISTSVDTRFIAYLQSPVTIDVEDCGAAYRFLLPILAATSRKWLLTGTPRLLQRPIMPLVEALRGIGADIERVEKGWLITGMKCRPVETQNFASLQIDASHSSQLASALVLAAPLLNLKTLRLTTTDIPSMSYLRMTLVCTHDWPVTIPGVEVPETPIGTSGDWSAALFWFAYARLHPEHTVALSPLSVESIQGDAIIYQWFKMLNMSISINGSNIEISAKPLKTMPHLVLDVRDNLDTVPVMASLAALLPADITFQNVRNLQYKESDRLNALATQLRPYADIEIADNELHVVGNGHPLVARAEFDTLHDHRLAMAFLLFPNAELNDTDCLRKSYPNLMSQLRQIGKRQ